MTKLILLVALFCWKQVVCQGKEDYCHMMLVLDSQKQCYRRLAPEDTLAYGNLIKTAPVIRPRMISAIEREYPSSTLCQANHFNLVEGYNMESGDIYGLIWTDSTFYSYVNGSASGLPSWKDSKVKKKRFSELTKGQKEIVLHFNDWSNDIFKKTHSLPFPAGPLFYYMGTKADFTGQPRIESIAFCYYVF